MKQARLVSIQAIRAVAAAMVAIYHTHQHFSVGAVYKDSSYTDLIYGLGAAGVHIFFVISGLIIYVTTSGFDAFDLPDFFRRRLIRIYVPYWLFAVIYVAGFQLMGLPFRHDAMGIFGGIFLISPSCSVIIDPAWTLAFEVFFYICFGLAMLLGRTRGLMALTILFLGLVGYGHFLHPQTPTIARYTDVLLLEFIAGCWIGRLAIEHAIPPLLSHMFIVLAVVIFAGGLVLNYTHYSRTIVWGIPSALLVTGAVGLELRRGTPRVLQRFAVLGDSSYSLYLSHTLMIEMFLFTMAHVFGRPPAGNVSLWTFLILPFLVMTAHALYFLIERPAIRLALRVMKPRHFALPRQTRQQGHSSQQAG